jgi:hypothetical protein
MGDNILDRLLSAPKWRCKICMHTAFVIRGEDIAANIPIMEGHVKKHQAIVSGWKDDKTKSMNWQKYIEPVGERTPVA